MPVFRMSGSDLTNPEKMLKNAGMLWYHDEGLIMYEEKGQACMSFSLRRLHVPREPLLAGQWLWDKG